MGAKVSRITRMLCISPAFFILLACTAPELSIAEEAGERPIIYGFGSPATPEEIAAWDIDVRPDGKGLPPGSGVASKGAEIYALKCAACHGASGEGGLNDRLVVSAPGEQFPDSGDANSWQHRTVGNYWPHATTLFDYIRRSMPFTMPGSLQDDEVYSLTAHLLHLNHIISETDEMNAKTLPKVVMPAHGKFVLDDRQEHQEVH